MNTPNTTTNQQHMGAERQNGANEDETAAEAVLEQPGAVQAAAGATDGAASGHQGPVPGWYTLARFALRGDAAAGEQGAAAALRDRVWEYTQLERTARIMVTALRRMVRDRELEIDDLVNEVDDHEAVAERLRGLVMVLRLYAEEQAGTIAAVAAERDALRARCAELEAAAADDAAAMW
ncbi:hypothetical protein B0T26DRAFT_756673 [Lasiosphaeria miniovina]|uniref:Uncharacterized protein n=1 Tax=Lasiosphaeria miniovina TaxID=1954250 RepID=A0AA40DIZ9_9PEZI|nr:uncharacterized protein B0T26DRAFT_756673 [Lasiosphaeria miniovina]KAK0703101.1 hypothetical protein B0T26DRAFT_756673 [Lasiosphaeria miniovina]